MMVKEPPKGLLACGAMELARRDEGICHKLGVSSARRVVRIAPRGALLSLEPLREH